jgi:Acyl-CoA carboxylase epsilon subunit
VTRPEPLFRIVGGDPDDDEVAALTAVLAALASRPAPEPLRTARGRPGRRHSPPYEAPRSWRFGAARTLRD